jgi:hypothetical protein
VLDRAADETADDIRTSRALDQKPALRGFAETGYRAKSWDKERRACASSSSAPASSKPPPESASPSPRRVPTPHYCANSASV